MLRKREQISKEVKRAVWDKSDGRCWYCGKRLNPFFTHYDHFEPHSKGGEDTVENLVLSCPHCNHSKKDMYVYEWRIKLYKSMGIGLSKSQMDMIRSEIPSWTDDPYAFEPVLLFYFERDEQQNRKSEGLSKYHVVINYEGWTR